MSLSVGERWQRFVEEAVNSGRYGSASEVVREGREARLVALRDAIDKAIAEGGEHSDADVAAALDAEAERLTARD